jgi:hypothetical protein
MEAKIMLSKTVNFSKYEDTITNLKNTGWELQSKDWNKAVLGHGLDTFVVYVEQENGG